MKTLFSRIITAALACGVSAAFSSCVGRPADDLALKGNLAEVSLTPQPGEIYADIVIADYGTITFKLFPDLAPKGVAQFVALAERGYYDTRNIHRVIESMLMQGGSFNLDGTDGDVIEDEKIDVEPSGFARNFYGALVLAPDADGMNYCQFYVVNDKRPADIDAAIEKLSAQLSETASPLTPEADTIYNDFLADMRAIPQDVKDMYMSRGGLFREDGRTTVIGQAIDGFDVIDAISAVQVTAGNTQDDIDGIISRPLNDIIIKSVTITRIPLPEPTTTTAEESTRRGRGSKTTTANPGITMPEESTTNTLPEDTFAESILSTDAETDQPTEIAETADSTDETAGLTDETYAEEETQEPEVTETVTDTDGTAVPMIEDDEADSSGLEALRQYYADMDRLAADVDIDGLLRSNNEMLAMNADGDYEGAVEKIDNEVLPGIQRVNDALSAMDVPDEIKPTYASLVEAFHLMEQSCKNMVQAVDENDLSKIDDAARLAEEAEKFYLDYQNGLAALESQYLGESEQ
jgi:cyclophilin family peptidyl-prolyl cis-trans isomerase